MSRLAPKIARDTLTLTIAFVLLVLAFYGLRRLDPGATIDGLGNLFLAMQVIIIGFAAASASGAIYWLLFGMLGRTRSLELCNETWRGFATVCAYRLTWLIIFYLLFSSAVGR